MPPWQPDGVSHASYARSLPPSSVPAEDHRLRDNSLPSHASPTATFAPFPSVCPLSLAVPPR
eukprot:scaffold275056_cov35-Tisochrysis_lutea.AAC.1